MTTLELELVLRAPRRHWLLAAVHEQRASGCSYLSFLPDDMRREHLDKLICPPLVPVFDTLDIHLSEGSTEYALGHGISLRVNKPDLAPAWTIFVRRPDDEAVDISDIRQCYPPGSVQHLLMNSPDPLVLDAVHHHRWLRNSSLTNFILFEDYGGRTRVPLRPMLGGIEHLLPLELDDFCYRPLPPGTVAVDIRMRVAADGTVTLESGTSA